MIPHSVCEAISLVKMASWDGAASVYARLSSEDQKLVLNTIDQWQHENLMAAIRIHKHLNENGKRY